MPKDYVDTDLDAQEIKKDVNLRELEAALNYQGEEEIYQELEDDFFAKMIRGEMEENNKKPKEHKPNKKVAPKVESKTE